jgi:hypothetical protein
MRPAVMVLEDRKLLSSIQVTSTADSGTGTLRAAVQAANADTSPSKIVFDLGSSPATITLTSGVLDLTNTSQSVSIYDGSGQGPVTISGKHASGVFQVESGVTASLTGLTITGGSAATNGGGLNNNGGTVTLTGCTVSGNTAANGGGIANSGTITLTNCTVSGNSCIIPTALDVGGGLYDNGGTVTLTGCTISGNSARAGGGINSSGTVTLTSCTISGNSAASGGGFMGDYTTLTLTGCTVSGNSVSTKGQGGGIYLENGTAALEDTIVASNTGGSSADDISGKDASKVTGTFNLIGTGGSGGITDESNGNIVLTDLTTLGLAPLGNNGGPTLTMALLPGSAAIGAGTEVSGVTTDQRGEPLDSPDPDIGAFQTQGSTLIALTYSGISNQSITYGTSSVTFSGTLSNGNQAPGSNESVAVKVHGITQNAAIGAGGAFSVTINTASLAVSGSPYTVTFSYTSDGTYASASTTGKLTVTKAAPTIALTSSGGSAVHGQTVTFVATVTAPGGTPTGTVTFFAGVTTLGSATVDSSGTATLSTSALATAVSAVTATYNGSTNLVAAKSGSVSVTVAKASTQIVFLPQPVRKHKKVVSVELEAFVNAVAPGSGVPTLGRVTFEVKQKKKFKVLGFEEISNGMATLTVKASRVVKKPITILFGGSTNFLASTVSHPALTQHSLKSMARPMIMLLGSRSHGHAHTHSHSHSHTHSHGHRGRA